MTITFGTFNLAQKRDEAKSGQKVFAELLEQVKLAEELGFETAWLAEHHFSYYSLCPSPLVVAAHLATATERIKLGTAVLVLPLYEPARLVQEIALVDCLSNGRLLVGIGSGYQDYEFDRFRVKLDGAMDMTGEMLDIIERALTQESFAYQGKHYTIPETRISVKPVQQPMPEMWVAGMLANEAIKHRVARKGYIPFLAPALGPTANLKPAREAYDEAYRTAGVDPLGTQMGLMRYCHVTESKKAARDAAERCRYSSRVSMSLRLNYYRLKGLVAEDPPMENEPALEEMQQNMIIGDAETCAQHVLEDHDIMRTTHVCLYSQPGGLEHKQVMKSLEKFTTEVVPIVEKELAGKGVTVRMGPAPARTAAAE